MCDGSGKQDSSIIMIDWISNNSTKNFVLKIKDTTRKVDNHMSHFWFSPWLFRTKLDNRCKLSVWKEEIWLITYIFNFWMYSSPRYFLSSRHEVFAYYQSVGVFWLYGRKKFDKKRNCQFFYVESPYILSTLELFSAKLIKLLFEPNTA